MATQSGPKRAIMESATTLRQSTVGYRELFPHLHVGSMPGPGTKRLVDAFQVCCRHFIAILRDEVCVEELWPALKSRGQ